MLFALHQLGVSVIPKGPDTLDNKQSNANKQCENANFSLVNYSCINQQQGKYVYKIR